MGSHIDNNTIETTNFVALAYQRWEAEIKRQGPLCHVF